MRGGSSRLTAVAALLLSVAAVVQSDPFALLPGKRVRRVEAAAGPVAEEIFARRQLAAERTTMDWFTAYSMCGLLDQAECDAHAVFGIATKDGGYAVAGKYKTSTMAGSRGDQGGFVLKQSGNPGLQLGLSAGENAMLDKNAFEGLEVDGPDYTQKANKTTWLAKWNSPTHHDGGNTVAEVGTDLFVGGFKYSSAANAILPVIIKYDPSLGPSAFKWEVLLPIPIPSPTRAPSQAPTDTPTTAPTTDPTDAPTKAPTTDETGVPTDAPTDSPTAAPTFPPTDAPTDAPTAAPTNEPTDPPTTNHGAIEVCQATSDGGLVCVGVTNMAQEEGYLNGFKSYGNPKNGDMFVCKFSAAHLAGATPPAAPTWYKLFPQFISGKGIREIPAGGGYIIGAHTNPDFNEVTRLHFRYAVVVKLDANGNLLWSKQHTAHGEVTDIALLTDGSIAICGHKHGSVISTDVDGSVTKLTANGTFVWRTHVGNPVGGKHQFVGLGAGNPTLIYGAICATRLPCTSFCSLCLLRASAISLNRSSLCA